MSDFIDGFAVKLIKNMITALGVVPAIYNSGHIILIQRTFKQNGIRGLQATVK
jgi:hypothetical protein